MIIFKTKYLELIKNGQKKSTIRFWKRKNSYKENDVVFASNYKEKIKIKIMKIYNKHVENLTQEEAIMDGFDSVNSLHRAIFNIYGKIDFDATILIFEVL